MGPEVIGGVGVQPGELIRRLGCVPVHPVGVTRLIGLAAVVGHPIHRRFGQCVPPNSDRRRRHRGALKARRRREQRQTRLRHTHFLSDVGGADSPHQERVGRALVQSREIVKPTSRVGCIHPRGAAVARYLISRGTGHQIPAQPDRRRRLVRARWTPRRSQLGGAVDAGEVLRVAIDDGEHARPVSGVGRQPRVRGRRAADPVFSSLSPGTVRELVARSVGIPRVRNCAPVQRQCFGRHARAVEPRRRRFSQGCANQRCGWTPVGVPVKCASSLYPKVVALIRRETGEGMGPMALGNARRLVDPRRTAVARHPISVFENRPIPIHLQRVLRDRTWRARHDRNSRLAHRHIPPANTVVAGIDPISSKIAFRRGVEVRCCRRGAVRRAAVVDSVYPTQLNMRRFGVIGAYLL